MLYMVGFVLTYLSIESMELPLVFLAAKFSPSALEKGDFNSNYVMTTTGTIGKFLGCMLPPLLYFKNE